MQTPLTPEGARSWLRVLLEITERATPITLLLILLIGGLTSHYFLRELQRTRQINAALWQQLMASEKAQVALAWRCAQGETRPSHEEP